MATKLFKDGKTEFFPAESVARQIEAGWSASEEAVRPVRPVAKKPVAKKPATKAKD